MDAGDDVLAVGEGTGTDVFSQQQRAGFDDGDAQAVVGEFDRRGYARRAAADDQAIHARVGDRARIAGQDGRERMRHCAASAREASAWPTLLKAVMMSSTSWSVSTEAMVSRAARSDIASQYGSRPLV